MVLALTRLTLSHFRSHKVSRLEADTGPVVIHGPNGAGKTNILEAVSLFSPGRGLRRAVAADIARRPEALGWKLTGLLERDGQRHEIVLRSEGGAARQVQIDGKTASQLDLGRLLSVLWLVPSMDRLWTDAPEGRRRFLDRLTLSFFPDHARAALDYEKAMRERNRLLKDQVRDPGWYDALEAQMAAAGEAIARNRAEALRRIVVAQDEAGSTFPVAQLAILPGEGGPVSDAPGLQQALAAGRARDMAAGRSLVGPHRADLDAVYAAKDTRARDCSTGEQKALLVSLVLANARALTGLTGHAPILLLDEVAAHLDAGRREALFDEICGLGSQAWMTGTGPELFAEIAGRARCFEVTETEGVSDVRAA